MEGVVKLNTPSKFKPKAFPFPAVWLYLYRVMEMTTLSLEKQTTLDYNAYMAEWYRLTLADILTNKNLHYHQYDVMSAIYELDGKIALAEFFGLKTEGYEMLKNELYYLIYEIKERL